MRTFLSLGRVSNLPTVWSNTLAGVVLSGAAQVTASGPLFWLLLAMTLFYVGGMYLNDAFDADIDAVERPERPIPSGKISRAMVYGLGFSMMIIAELLLLFTDARAAGAGLVLFLAIVGYNYHHKNNPLSPALMGLCRVCIYLAAGLAVVSTGTLHRSLYWGAALLFCYLIGLTFAAKQENLGKLDTSWPLALLAAPIVYGLVHSGSNVIAWLLIVLLSGWVVYSVRHITGKQPGGIPRGVVSLIAGISLLDAMLISLTGNLGLTLLAMLCFPLTLFLQRYIAGT